MKRIAISILLFATIALLSASCGTSDYIESVQLNAQGATAGGSFNLGGVDFALQLQVNAVYHSGKTIPVTNNSTWTVTPVGCVFSGNLSSPCAGNLPAYGPTTVPINTTGLMQGIAQICTWLDPIDPTTGKPAVPPTWEYTGYYQVNATYRQFTSNPVGVGVGVTASNVAGCGPS